MNTFFKCFGSATKRLTKTETTVMKTVEYYVEKWSSYCVSAKINSQGFVLHGKYDSYNKLLKSEGVKWEVEVWFQHPLSGNK